MWFFSSSTALLLPKSSIHLLPLGLLQVLTTDAAVVGAEDLSIFSPAKTPTNVDVNPASANLLPRVLPSDPTWLKKLFSAISFEWRSAAFASELFQLTAPADGKDPSEPQFAPADLLVFTEDTISGVVTPFPDG